MAGQQIQSSENAGSPAARGALIRCGIMMLVALGAILIAVRLDPWLMSHLRLREAWRHHAVVVTIRRAAEVYGMALWTALVIIVERKRCWRVLWRAAAAMGLGWCVMELGKSFIVRDRPFYLAGDDWFASWHGFTTDFMRDDAMRSFPSGHTTNIVAMACVAAAIYPRWRWLFWGGAALTGLSRCAQNMHWPSDVLTGAVIGCVSARLVMTWWPMRAARL